VSFIHGPPGTGKTYNASVIVLSLSIEEQGKIIVCAPSNEGSNGIAEAIR
jgi:DNA replication protein DnaC